MSLCFLCDVLPPTSFCSVNCSTGGNLEAALWTRDLHYLLLWTAHRGRQPKSGEAVFWGENQTVFLKFKICRYSSQTNMNCLLCCVVVAAPKLQLWRDPFRKAGPRVQQSGHPHPAHPKKSLRSCGESRFYCDWAFLREAHFVKQKSQSGVVYLLLCPCFCPFKKPFL